MATVEEARRKLEESFRRFDPSLGEAGARAAARGRETYGPARQSSPARTIDGSARLAEIEEAEREFRRRYPDQILRAAPRPSGVSVAAPVELREVVDPVLQAINAAASAADLTEAERRLAASFIRRGLPLEGAILAGRGRRGR